jgi:6-phosphogluconate dehydrogenase
MLDPDGIHYVGIGVSGGHQAARHGPSMSPGGRREALELVMPVSEKVAAKGKQGRLCVKPLGPGGCEHYVKMVHDGIEQGMMSMLCEV